MTGFDERMAQLRARFIARTETQQLEIEDALTAGDREELRRLAHSLAGSAGIFGFPEISADAHALEDAVDAGAEADEIQRLSRLLLDRLTVLGR